MPLDKYVNYCKFLEEHFEVLTSKEDFKVTKKIEFRCKVTCHVYILSQGAFGNKKAKVPLRDWCEACKQNQEYSERFGQFEDEVKHLGYEILSVDFSTKKVEFVCGNCGTKGQSFTRNFKREGKTGYCNHCQNDSRRLSYTELKQKVEVTGMRLLTRSEEYRSNKQKLRLICVCGNGQYEAVLSDIRAGKNCSENCKTRKFEATCIDRYGVRNVSQVLEVEEKMAKRRRTTKEYTFLSGRLIHVEGFENLALDILLQTYQENDLLVGAQDNIPCVWYEMDGKRNRYTPDIYIRSKNTLVEVKFLYFYDKQRDKNILKFKSTLKNGYSLKLLFFDKNEAVREFDFKPDDTFADDFLDPLRNGLYWID